MTAEIITHRGGILTIRVLTKEQLKAGYYLKEDDQDIFICKYGYRKFLCSLNTMSDAIREAVDKLKEEVNKIKGIAACTCTVRVQAKNEKGRSERGTPPAGVKGASKE